MITVDPAGLNDLSTPLGLLLSRRSGKARDMVAPGPDREQLAHILTIAARVPDHGKLAPWRFVLIEDRVAFADLLDRAYRLDQRGEPGRLESRANAEFAHQAPVLVAAIFAPRTDSRIPLDEQHLSMGASIFSLGLAATAQGYVASWLTGWAAYSTAVAAGLGLSGEERIAGFIFLGSPSATLAERPRPALADIVRHWPG